MEFDIGNLLYVIITIVVIAVGLLGKKKKPTGTGDGGTSTVRRPGFLENLERLLDQDQQDVNFGEEVDRTVQLEGEGYIVEDEDTGNVIKDVPVSSVIEDEPSNTGILEEYERMMERQSETTAPEEVPLEIIELDEDSGTDYFEVISDFNAAKAIVYSAIINRIDY